MVRKELTELFGDPNDFPYQSQQSAQASGKLLATEEGDALVVPERKNLLFDEGDAKTLATVACDLDDYKRMKDAQDRRLYLYGPIEPVDFEMFGVLSTVSRIVEQIVDFNREDQNIPPEERKPIRLYINSPGGELVEGFALISTIGLSKTPVWTINMGQWSSMAFLIGITGHRRFTLPNAMFLMHDGTSGAFGSTNKVQDQVKFEERFEREVVKEHVLAHSNIKSIDYDDLKRVELYMLPKDAKERGCVDEIVTDINTIL